MRIDIIDFKNLCPRDIIFMEDAKHLRICLGLGFALLWFRINST